MAESLLPILVMSVGLSLLTVVVFLYLWLTERKRHQALYDQLRQSEQRYRLLAENSSDVIWTLDNQLQFTYVSPSIRRLRGLEPEEALKEGVQQSMTPRSFELVSQELARSLEAEARGERDIGARVEVQQYRKDGSLVWVEVIVQVMFDQAGQRSGMIGVSRDISARKASEEALRSLNAELEERVARRTAELETKNRELERFAYSVSHDLKAPLRGIDGYGALLEQDYDGQLDSQGHEFIQNIRKGTLRMNQIIDGLLEYSRLERRAFSTALVDPAAVVQALLSEHQAEITRLGIEVTLALPYMRLKAEAEGLSQALRNLLDNAIKFTRDVPRPHIEIGGRMDAEAGLLWVKDNGIGFDMKYHGLIFDIFQHLHRAEDYPGTGLGLAIVRKAMERMGGRVWAESTPGQGATFFLEFPR